MCQKGGNNLCICKLFEQQSYPLPAGNFCSLFLVLPWFLTTHHLEFPLWSCFQCQQAWVCSLLIASRLHKAKSRKCSIDLQKYWRRSDWLFFPCFIMWHWNFLEMHSSSPLPCFALLETRSSAGTPWPIKSVTLQSYIRTFWPSLCCMKTSEAHDAIFQLNIWFAECTYLLLCLEQVFVDNVESLKPQEEVKPRREVGDAFIGKLKWWMWRFVLINCKATEKRNIQPI